MAKRGRPDKLTPEVVYQITNVVSAGNYLQTAAAYAGISKVTLFKWIKRGRTAKTGKYRNFVEQLDQALARCEVGLVAGIRRFAEKDWKAAAWMLGRKFPSRWGQRVEPVPTGSKNAKRPWKATLKPKIQ
jgi:transposase